MSWTPSPSRFANKTGYATAPAMGYDAPMCYRFIIAAVLLVCLMSLSFADTLAGGLFTITYDAKDAQNASRALAVLEAAVREFGDCLPAGDGSIEVVIAGTLRSFGQQTHHFAAGMVSGIARSAQSRIIVKSPRIREAGGDFQGTLRHELVHILLYRNTDVDRLPKWLNEGIAMSLANEYHWASPIRVARMFLSGRVIAYAQLDRAFMAPGGEMEFGDAYAQALSMTRHMRNELGEDTFWKVVLGTKDLGFLEAMRQYAGMTPAAFWDGYARSLWWIALIGGCASGSFLGPAWIILVVAYIRRRGKNRKILKQWAVEEALDDETFHWEDVMDDPEGWKREDDGEEEVWTHGSR